MSYRHYLLAAGSIMSAALACSAHAQTSGSTIEELVVTAEKREQSLQDVPVAVSAFSSERRETVGISSVQDLTNLTPGLAYSTNNDRINMRGIGRFTNNRSADGGVAMYVDGVYTSSVTSFAKSTLFIDRTEVLRGPQGTLYGRNAIGGAMNIISKKPTDTFQAEVRTGYANYDNAEVEGMISGPLLSTGDIRGRLTGSYTSQGKGYFHNLNPNGKSEGGRGDQWDIQGQLDGKTEDGKFEWWLSADTAEWHNLGRGPGGRTTATYGLRDVTSTNTAALTPNSAFGLSPQLPGDQCQFCFDTDDGNYISLETNSYSGTATLHLNNVDVKYITGLTYYDYRLQTDQDATSRQTPFLLPAPASLGLPAGTSQLLYPRQNNQYEEEVWWFSNELNFTSTYDGPVQWLVGLYQFREGSNYTLSDARYPDDPRFDRPVLYVSPGSLAQTPAAPNLARQYGYGTSSNVSESYASFGQVDWQATDQFKFTAGLRYTYDRKRSTEGARLMCFLTPTCASTFVTGRPTDITAVAAPGTTTDPSVVGGPYTDPNTGIRYRLLRNHWDAVTGTLGVDWKPDADTLGYAKYTRGYKAGGFNAGTTTLQSNITTGKETINAYEIGLKKTLNRTIQVNASAFYYDYRNLQVPITGLNPVTNTNTTSFFNVPKARNMGVELETIWQPIDHLQILANYSYLNAEIRKGCCFTDPNDPRGIQPGAVLSGNSAAALANPTTALNQDLKGAKLPSSTPHRVSLNANYTWDLDYGTLTASGTYIWKAATYYDIFNRYYNRAKAWDQSDFRLLYNDKHDKYTVIGYVKNAFNSHGSAGISGTRITTGQFINYVNETVSYVPPRTYGVELQYRF